MVAVGVVMKGDWATMIGGGVLVTTVAIGAVAILNGLANRSAEQDDEHWREIERMRKKENERGR